METSKLSGHRQSGMPKFPRFSPDAVRVIDVLTCPAVQLLDVTGNFAFGFARWPNDGKVAKQPCSIDSAQGER